MSVILGGFCPAASAFCTGAMRFSISGVISLLTSRMGYSSHLKGKVVVSLAGIFR
jgi:hypothetical protein